MNHQLLRVLRPFVHRVTDARRTRNIEREVLSRFSNLKASELKGKLVIDLGANRGDFSVWAASCGAHVIAMEPDKTAFRYLMKRTSRLSNIFALNAGALNRTSFVKLYFHENRAKDPLGHTISSSIDAQKKNVSKINFEEILVINIEEILANFKVFLLKVDIEGAEILLWEGIKKYSRNIEHLLMETHENQIESDYSDFVQFIEKNELQKRWKLDWV